MRAVPDFDALIPGHATPHVGGEMPPVDDNREATHREIARELHDTVIQPLTALVVGLRSQQHSAPADAIASRVGAWHELAEEALDALRATLAGLRTHPHAELGLPGAVRHYLIPQLQQRGLELHLESAHWPSDLPADLTSSLYLAVREAVTNAEKHGHASQVSVVLRADGRQLMITVADNGTGFVPDEVGASRGARWRERVGSGLGLQGMHDRARLLGGQLRLMAAPAGGVQVEMVVPAPDIADLAQARRASGGESGEPPVPSRGHVH